MLRSRRQVFAVRSMAARPSPAEAAAAAAKPPLVGRAWVDAAPSPSSSTPLVSLRVVTYNMLAQCYTRSTWQTWSEPACLKWKRRSASLLQELVALRPDVAFLQEVDDWPHWEAALAKHGLVGRWKKRTRRKRDGCAVVWRADVLEAESFCELEHNVLADAFPPDGAAPAAGVAAGDEAAKDATPASSQPDALPEDNGEPSGPRARLERDSVGLFVCFKLRGASANASSLGDAIRFFAATTHLYWDPRLADVKLAQAKHTLSQLAAFVSASPLSSSQPVRILLGGDFNSTPGSEVHEALLAAHTVDALSTGADDGQAAPPAVADGSRPPPLAPLPRLRSAYGPAEPALSTHTPTFTACIDYLLHSEGGLRVSRFLAPPDKGTLGKGLPDARHPSDHLPLAADIFIV